MFGKKSKSTAYPVRLPKKKIIRSFDALDAIEMDEHKELPERMHDLSEKPTKPLKRARNSPRSAYRPMRGGRK